jgi:hypothetical protein
MARNTLANLALEAGLSPEDAWLTLFELGLEPANANTPLRKQRVRQFRTALGLSARPIDATEVRVLCRRANVPEAEARDRLTRAGCLAKRRLKRVPKALLRQAEKVLGIGQASEPPPTRPCATQKPRPNRNY